MKYDSKHYRKLFSKLHDPQPPADLAQKTLLAIARYERRVLLGKLVGLGAMFAASLTVVVMEATAAGAQLGQSGFFQFAALFFSDFSMAARNLPDISLSMLESFPAFPIGLAIGGLVIAIWSFVGFVDDANVLSRS